MSSVAELVARLRELLSGLDRTAGVLRTAREELTAGADRLGTAATGSADPRAAGARTATRQGIRHTEAALAALRATDAGLSNYLATITGTPTLPRQADPAGRGPVAHPRPDPAKVAKLRRIGWPKNDNGRTQARALFCLPDGSEPISVPKPLRALGPDRVFDTPGLRPEYRDRSNTISWHVEGGVAKWLRAHPEVKQADLYLNIPVCGVVEKGAGPHPMKCAKNLSSVLPKGTLLTVWVVRPNQEPRPRKFRGTGEGIRP